MSKQFKVIITGQSHAGLSAAKTLGRSMCKALIPDSGNPVTGKCCIRTILLRRME